MRGSFQDILRKKSEQSRMTSEAREKSSGILVFNGGSETGGKKASPNMKKKSKSRSKSPTVGVFAKAK